MKSEYNFSKMKEKKNPYAQKLKQQITIRLGQDIIAYFKKMAAALGSLIPTDIDNDSPKKHIILGNLGHHHCTSDELVCRRHDRVHRRPEHVFNTSPKHEIFVNFRKWNRLYSPTGITP